MPSKRSGLRRSPRTPLQTPPKKPASPKTPASGLGSSAKRKRTSGRLSARKGGKAKKSLNKSFNQDDVDPDEEIDESAAGDSRDEVPDPSELVPGDPPSRLDQLANSSDPLMQLVAEELRASKAVLPAEKEVMVEVADVDLGDVVVATKELGYCV